MNTTGKLSSTKKRGLSVTLNPWFRDFGFSYFFRIACWMHCKQIVGLAEPKCIETGLKKSQICPIWGQSDPIWRQGWDPWMCPCVPSSRSSERRRSDEGSVSEPSLRRSLLRRVSDWFLRRGKRSVGKPIEIGPSGRETLNRHHEERNSATCLSNLASELAKIKTQMIFCEGMGFHRFPFSVTI